MVQSRVRSIRLKLILIAGASLHQREHDLLPALTTRILAHRHCWEPGPHRAQSLNKGHRIRQAVSWARNATRVRRQDWDAKPGTRTLGPSRILRTPLGCSGEVREDILTNDELAQLKGELLDPEILVMHCPFFIAARASDPSHHLTEFRKAVIDGVRQFGSAKAPSRHLKQVQTAATGVVRQCVGAAQAVGACRPPARPDV